MDVSILGRQFRVACTEDEKQELQKAVSYLDSKMRVDGVDLGEVRRRMAEMRTKIDEVLAAQDELF